MCMELCENCERQSHRSKHSLSAELPVDDDQVDCGLFFICATKARNSVYVSPLLTSLDLAPAAMEILKDRYLPEERTREDWISIFDTLSQFEAPDEAGTSQEMNDLEENLKLVESALKQSMEPKTPMPPKRLKYMASPASDDEEGDWSKVAPTKNDLDSSIRALCREISDAFESSDRAAMKTRQFLGSRPDNWGTASLTHVVNRLALDVGLIDKYLLNYNQLLGLMEALYSALSDANDGTKGQPAETLFRTMNDMQRYVLVSTQQTLFQRIQEVDAKIATIQATSAPNPATGQSHGFTGVPTPPACQTGPTYVGGAAPAHLAPQTGHASGVGGAHSGVAIDPAVLQAAVAQAVTAQVKVIHERITTVEAMSGGDDITFQGDKEVFRSRQDCIAWCTKHGVAETDMVYFCDAHGLLALGFSDYEATSEVLRNESNTAKAGHTSVHLAQLKASFKIPLPTFFGKTVAKEDKQTVKDSRVLPRILRYKYWDDSTGHTGLRHEFDALMSKTSGDLMEEAVLNLTPAALHLSNAVLFKTQVALTKMSTWMTGSVQDLIGQGIQPVSTWPLTSHVV